ncbi:MAG: arginine deiminase family protein [Bacillota bacterium]|nr:arginine deiminase family protein [Bacillota bacterium]
MSLQLSRFGPRGTRLTAAESRRLHPCQAAEWQTARVVLLCEPDVETLFGILETHSANFLHPFDLVRAKAEHRRFREELEARGARVIDLRQALTCGCIDQADEPVPGEKLDRLRRAADAALTYDFDAAIGPDDRRELLESKWETIRGFHPDILADLVLLRPTVTIRPNPRPLDPTSRFVSEFRLEPADNQYFLRDPMITTRRGVAIGRFRLDVRKAENDNVALALEQMGIEPVVRVAAPGHLEGGDFLPAGDLVFQGVGLLSDDDGIAQLLEARAYGYVEVAVVRDPRAEMDEMHLDTYFNLLAPRLAVLCEDRLRGSDEPTVELYRPEGTPDSYRYRLVERWRFGHFLESRGFEVIPFTKDEQEAFAPNYLLTAEGSLVGVASAGASFEERLRAHGVRTHMMDFTALTGGYGGPHCMSQVIVRG